MIDFIPIEHYTAFYHYMMLIVVLVVFLHTQTQQMYSPEVLRLNTNFGVVTLVLVLLYMGLRPVHVVFSDMVGYSYMFNNYANGYPITSTKDVFFHVFAKFSSQIMSVHTYFVVCAALYIIPLYLVCKKWFKGHWFYGFLFLIVSFEFWAYGTNGIRNGIAGSLFLLGVSREKKLWQIVFIVLAISFHKTMLLPTMGFLLARVYNRPKQMIAFWTLCIVLSLMSGGFFENFFATIGFDEDRLEYLTQEVREGRFSRTGFRWDFLLYSSTAIFAGWFYIVKRKFNDKIYFWLFNTYVFANAFWILVIRANFSNRFAYLSWFMIGLVIIYPLLKQPLIPIQHRKIGLILLVYFGFTFLLNVVLKYI
ncbi:EpsG-like putative glucosyltransferase [Winogradskyella epiphytica]|uniref:EpsG-like putative glucosyltransferase n=1 Tax=Winogradskyella epiphytica TaxID=262005 RepID=A0A2V4X9H3_9FLAO|nr:EpsG family protein [Winogradskyella epiphytica]PYE82705.1 EpsG-like putative glucosyltransferase [Winogradskyella epiphytica]GGW53092.1 hypothetical protein GCM10008085_00110 [Winogradskyella epiphytica]